MDRVVRWWLPDPENPNDETDRANALIDETAAIETRQSAWHELALWNATLYTNRVLPGFRWGELDGTQELWPTNLHTENLIENIGEAMLSKASSSPLKPTLQPNGQSLQVERAVRLLDNFLFGAWRQTKAEDACVLMFRDAFIASVGWVRVGFEDGAVSVNSVFFDNVIIDNRECLNRQPPRTYRIRQCLPRASIEAKYGELPPRGDRSYVPHRDVGDGWEILVEAFRKPDASGKGGWWMIACNGKVLKEGPWTHHWVPLVPFHWKDPESGFYTRSGVEQLVPYQLKLNQLNDDIAESQSAACKATLMAHANTQLDYSNWDNKGGRFILFAGQQPIPLEWPTNLNELYNERERTKQNAHSHMGISEMFTGADLPNQVRLDSSAGVREARNMEDSRNLRLWTTYEDARMEVARTILRVLGISKGADAFEVFYHPGQKASAERIPYEAIKTLQEDEYSWSMQATPLSQMMPAARRELLRDWSSRGLVEEGSEEARRFEGHPNLEQIESLEMAGQDDIKRHLAILEKGDYEPPTELTNLTVGIPMVIANYHRLHTYDDVKDKVLQNHIRWIVQGTTIQQMAVAGTVAPTPFAPTQGMAGTNAAMGAPMMGPPGL